MNVETQATLALVIACLAFLASAIALVMQVTRVRRSHRLRVHMKDAGDRTEVAAENSGARVTSTVAYGFLQRRRRSILRVSDRIAPIEWRKEEVHSLAPGESFSWAEDLATIRERLPDSNKDELRAFVDIEDGRRFLSRRSVRELLKGRRQAATGSHRPRS